MKAGILFTHLFFVAIIFSFTINSSCKNSAAPEANEAVEVTDSPKKKIESQKAIIQKPTGWVNDYEHILDDKSIKEITHLIEAHQKKTGNQIAVVTTLSYAPYDSIGGYALALGNQWGIGQKEKNNGVLIVVSSLKHEVRIATGLGMEEKLPDDYCEVIINENMIPEFKKGDYATGIKSALILIIRILEQRQ